MKAALVTADDYRDLGRLLKDTREGMGLGLGQVAAQLRIRESFLSALEKGDLSVLPGDVYARGYLKSYAEHLGYDGSALLGRIVAEPRRNTIPAGKYLPPERSRRVPKFAVPVMLVCALALIAVWLTGGDDDVDVKVEPLPETMTELVDRGTPRVVTKLPEECLAVSGPVADALCAAGYPLLAVRTSDGVSSLLRLPEALPDWNREARLAEAEPVADAAPPGKDVWQWNIAQ